MVRSLLAGAFLIGGLLTAEARAVAIDVTYQGTSWVEDGVAVAIATTPTGAVGVSQRFQNSRNPAQSFTTIEAFTLDKIWINYFDFQGGAEAYALELRLFEVANPNATNMVLSANLFSQPQTHQIPFSASNNPNNYAIFDVENVALKANQGYLFQFIVTGTSTQTAYPWEWRGLGGNLYSGGSYYRVDRSPNNQLFDQVFALQPLVVTLPPIPVATPEPATPVLALVGLAALARRRSRG
jgi:hypothetical protein